MDIATGSLQTTLPRLTHIARDTKKSPIEPPAGVYRQTAPERPIGVCQAPRIRR